MVLIILLVLLLFLACLALVKVVFILDTEGGVILIRQGIIFSIRGVADSEKIVLMRVRILGIPFTIDPTKMRRRKKSKKQKKKKKRGSLSWSRVKKIFNTFTIKKLHVSFDSGDFTRNAQLFPLVHWVNQSLDDRYWLEVNFIGENYLKTHIENRPIRVLLALIKKT